MTVVQRNSRCSLGIMELSELFQSDKRKEKVNLALGVYTNAQNISPIFKSVKNSEKLIFNEELTKANYEILGSQEFSNAVIKLLFPNYDIKLYYPKAITIQTLGSCGALYLSANTISQLTPNATVWISNPSWENHDSIFKRYTKISKYTYSPSNKHLVNLDLIKQDLSKAKEDDYVLLQVCCHNPTGIDLSIDQWKELAKFIKSKNLNVIFDFAYQGFSENINLDAHPIHIFSQYLDTIIIANSFSKNMGLYNERIGGLTLLFKDSFKQKNWLDAIKKCIRTTYTVPSIHGQKIVSKILNNSNLYKLWSEELSIIKEEINKKRSLLFLNLEKHKIFDLILSHQKQKGMFLLLNLDSKQIKELRNKYGIYLMDNGRISVSSINEENVDYICKSFSVVMRI